jgi:hypothetical protein
MLAEERSVLPPRFRRALVERVVQGKEDFGRLVDRLIHPVDPGPNEQDDDPADEVSDRQWVRGHRFSERTKP